MVRKKSHSASLLKYITASLMFLVLATQIAYTQTPTPSQGQIVITGNVAPKPADIEFDFALLNSSNIYKQGQDLIFEITYGSNTLGARPITIQVDWTKGQFDPGVSTPSVDVLDYVVGSATDAYNNTPAIVDPINRTITWEITNFPAQTTDQTVRFRLRTVPNYTNSQYPAEFTVNSTLTSQSLVIPESITRTYIYNYNPNAHFTATPAPPATPTPTPTPPPSIAFDYIIIPQIRNDRASIEVRTNIHSHVVFQYGNSPQRLTNRIVSNQDSTHHFLNLEDLTTDTSYYFRITAEDAYRTGRGTATSDIFTFRTALTAEAPKVETDSIIITSQKNIIYSAFDNKGEKGTATIPTETELEYKFTLNSQSPIKNILTVVRETSPSEENKVLGINNLSKRTPQTTFAQIAEISPGVYVGRLLSQPIPGLYELMVQIADFNGNVIEEEIASLKTTNPFSVYDSNTKQPIENAHATFSLFNESTRTFQFISPEILPIENPTFSESNGIVPVVLPPGKYRADVHSLLHENVLVEFTIGPDPGEEYPVLFLTPLPFSVGNNLKYYTTAIADLFSLTSNYTSNLAQSVRFFNLIAPLTLSLLITLTIFSFFTRTHITPITLPSFILYHLRSLFTRNFREKFVTGEVTDYDSKKAVSKAHIYLIDADKNKIIASTSTNKAGEFIVKKPRAKSYKVYAFKNKFEPSLSEKYSKESISFKSLNLQLKQFEEKDPYLIHELIFAGASALYGFLFELLLTISILFEIVFIPTFGLAQTLPFLLVSLVTLLLWMVINLKKILKRYPVNIRRYAVK